MQCGRSWGGCSIRKVRSTSHAIFLRVVAVLCLGAVTGVEATGMQDDPDDARAIVVRSFERYDSFEQFGEEPTDAAGHYRALMTSEAREYDGDGQVTEEQRVESEVLPINGATFTRPLTSETREYDGNGQVTEERRVEWEVIPIDGWSFMRRRTIDGQPLSGESLAEENAREAAFREDLRRRREGEVEPEEAPEENENEIVINEELFARFDFTLESEEQLRNRPSYRIAFAPREGSLPARGRIDRMINKVRGRIWIDRETFEFARLEYELMDTVRFGWGVLATLHVFRGSIDRGPALPGFWRSLQEEFYADIRILFRRSRIARISQWRDFEWTEESPEQGASVDPAPSASDEALQ